MHRRQFLASSLALGVATALNRSAAAQSRLGARFELRGFDEAVLEGGAMPLEVRERVINDWVKRS
jgi:uncharacterized protein (DUF885 family)